MFVSCVAWEGEVWLFLNVGRWDFFNFQRIILLVVWDGVVGERGWVYIYIFFFFSFFLVIW
jgi:hypothetical protein